MDHEGPQKKIIQIDEALVKRLEDEAVAYRIVADGGVDGTPARAAPGDS